MSADRGSPRESRFHTPYLEAGSQLLQERGLLGGDLDGLAGIPRLEREHRLVPFAAIGPVLQRQRSNLLHGVGRRRLRVALVDRRQIFQPIRALGMEPPLPLVDDGPVDATPPTRLGDVAKLPGQFQHAQTLLRHMAAYVPRHGFPRRRRSSNGRSLHTEYGTERRLSGQLIEW